MDILTIDLRKSSKKEKLEVVEAILFAQKMLKRESLKVFVRKINPPSKSDSADHSDLTLSN